MFGSLVETAQTFVTLMKGDYPTGITIAAQAMADLNIIPHEVMPAWNYTIAPSARKM